MSEFLGRYLKMNLTHNMFNIVFNESDLCNINPFYAEVLRAWDSVTKRKRFLSANLNDILSQPLFHNPLVTYKSKLLSFTSFIESDIVTVADITYEVVPGFLPVSAIVEIVRDIFPNMAKTEIVLAYNIILKALPDEWKEEILNNTITPSEVKNMFLINNNTITHTSKLTVKFIYTLLISDHFKPPTGIEKWNVMGFDIAPQEQVWKLVHFKSEFVDLDFKITHNIIFTYSRLFKYGIVVSNQCPVCLKHEEDICHLFLYCKELYDLIKIFQEMCI